MSAQKASATSIESLEGWLSAKPYWEQYVWKLNLEKDALTEEDVERCYAYLCEHLELRPSTAKKQPISFNNQIALTQDTSGGLPKIKIREVTDFVDVNAIAPECSVKFGPNLTVIYGPNGSGKSGVGRLLCNACFSRGDREILHNVKTSLSMESDAKATFLLEDEAGHLREIEYTVGDNNKDLKRFSVFDVKSVLIHLDHSNNVNFTPAQVKIFDKVADTISKLEGKLINDRNALKKDSPFLSMFLENATSDTALFCKSITAGTKEVDFLKHASFDSRLDGATIKNLEGQIDAKRRLDIPKRRSQLTADCQNLEALKASLEKVTNVLTAQKMTQANTLTSEILEKKKLVESLSAETFDDGLFKTIGGAKWKAFITAAKSLYDAEKSSNKDRERHTACCATRNSQAMPKRCSNDIGNFFRARRRVSSHRPSRNEPSYFGS